MTSYLILFICVNIAMCTVDINIHQLQMIADHLTKAECAKLVDALHQKTFLLKDAPTHDEREASKTCIYHLLLWDRTEGINQTFVDLTLRLKQIGRTDLADRLSDSVFAEEIETLEEKFLKDPFKENIPKKSVLLEKDKDDDDGDDAIQPADDDKRLTGWEIFSIVLGVITAIFIVVFVVYKLFGNLIQKMCRKYAPEFVLEWTDLICGECKWLCKKTRRKYAAEVIGVQNTKPSRLSVMEMNKNLNNYLNGHLKDAFYYFPENC